MFEKLLEIQTEYGKVRGRKRQSVLGRDFYSFQRIPYMKAPIGKLRFVDPEPPERWDEILDCTQEGPPFCNLFFLDNKYQGSLEGIHINVYSTNLHPSKALPVLVWIHGGGIFTGNATEEITGPDYLMQKDIVLVTFQYRMGVFGFLSLEDPSLNIPGNAQFKDQTFALKWVQKNIKNFGGDADNVTLFGESWGGGAACYHMISDKSRGLFHRAILMSGSALNNIYSHFPRRDWALRLCIKLNYDNSSHTDKEILEFLENADEKEIIEASSQLLTEKEKKDEAYMIGFGPTIEPYDNGNAFLNDEIIKMVQKGWGKDIDIIIGNTSNECMGITQVIKTQEILDGVNSFQRYISRDLNLEVDSEKRLEYAEILKRNYYGDLEPSLDNLNGIAHVCNDFFLIHPMFRFIMSRLTHGRGKTFAYRFDYLSKNNLMREFYKIDRDIPEAMHGDDNAYIFKMSAMEGEDFDLSINSPEFNGIKIMIGIFTDFAKNGDPQFDAEWEPVTIEEPYKGLNISEKGSKVINFPELDRIKVFNKFYEEQHKILF